MVCVVSGMKIQTYNFIQIFLLIGLIILWSQFLFVPFWGDDYIFLLNSEQSRLGGESWISNLWPDRKDQFWRPFSEDIYWRFIETVLGGNPVLGHISNLILHVCVFLSVSWFAATFTRHENIDPVPVLAAGFFYCVHSSHFLPLAWISAANVSIMTMLVVLSMGCWFQSFNCMGIYRISYLVICLLTYILALLSKEIAATLPVIIIIMSLIHRPQLRFDYVHWATLIIMSGLVFVYLEIRNHLTGELLPTYRLELGLNVLRNSGSLLAYFLNVPREALRFVVEQRSFMAMIWGVSCLSLQGYAIWILYMGAKPRLDWKRISFLFVFFVISCGPYFLFAWNSYAYYISVGLVGFAVFCALATGDRNRTTKAAILALTSSGLSTVGNHYLEYPSLLGRANWSERQLAILESQRNRLLVSENQVIYVVVHNDHLFSGIGRAGLAYRLDIPISEIIIKTSCSGIQGKQILRVRNKGDMEITSCPPF